MNYCLKEEEDKNWPKGWSNLDLDSLKSAAEVNKLTAKTKCVIPVIRMFRVQQDANRFVEWCLVAGSTPTYHDRINNRCFDQFCAVNYLIATHAQREAMTHMLPYFLKEGVPLVTPSSPHLPSLPPPQDINSSGIDTVDLISQDGASPSYSPQEGSSFAWPEDDDAFSALY